MKKTSLLLAVIIIALLLVSCTSGNTSSVTSSSPTAVSDKKPVEISVVTSYGGDDGNRQSYEKAYQAYEANSGNIVKDNSAISNEAWKAQVMASFDDGSEPDVLFYFMGADSNTLIEGGKVVSIDEIRSIYPDYASNMREEVLVESPVDGKCYAVPVNGYWEALYVNKKVLEDCGVSIPDANTTWEQFLEDCEKIAAKGYIPIAASLAEIPHYWFEFCILNNGSIETHPELPVSSTDTAGQRWVAGLGDIKMLYDRGFFPPNTTTMSSAESDVLMTDNKAAFMIDGSWKLGWFAENASDINNFTVTYVPGKGERKSTDIISGLSMGYFITRKAWDNPEKRAACVEFITAMTTDEVVATFGEASYTALKQGISPSPNANSLVRDALSMNTGVTGFTAATADSLRLNSRSYLFSCVRDIVTGEITAEEAIDGCLAIDS